MHKQTIPIRTCVGCKEKFEKKVLNRFVLVNTILTLDKENKLTGRGVYLCEDCLRKYISEGQKEKSVLQRKMRYVVTKKRKE